jgi:hypothetical protein
MSMTAPGGRWWRRARDEAQARARQAKGEAAATLLALDSALRSTEARISLALDHGGLNPQGAVAQDWQAVQAEGGAAMAEYATADDVADLDSDISELVSKEAARFFTACSQRMAAATLLVEELPERHRAAFDKVTQTLTRLQQEATERERREARDRAELEQRQAQDRADRERLIAESEATVHRRLPSLHTRVQAVHFRLQQPPAEVLRELRREFVSACWADVEDAHDRAAEHLQHAQAQLADVQRTLVPEGNDWLALTERLQEVTRELREAELDAGAPAERLAMLRTFARADPRERTRPLRAALRDAQQLLMAGVRTPALERTLEDLDRRVTHVSDPLQQPHPDFWAVMRASHELDLEIARFVQQVRAVRRST